jgi:hypothetical protein
MVLIFYPFTQIFIIGHKGQFFRISLYIDTFSSNIVGILYHLKGSLLKINLKTTNDKKKLIAIINGRGGMRI